MAMLSDMGASFIVVSNGLRLLNNKAEATVPRQSILPVERTSNPILIDLEDDDDLPLLPRGQNYPPTYGTPTTQSTGGLTPPLGKKACTDCKKDCKGKGKTVQTPVTLEDKSDLDAKSDIV